MNSDELLELTLQHIDSDRRALRELYGQVAGSEELLMSSLETVVKLFDSLTKQTGQIVELVKIKQKQEVKTAAADDEDVDTNDIFNRIEQGHGRPVSR